VAGLPVSFMLALARVLALTIHCENILYQLVSMPCCCAGFFVFFCTIMGMPFLDHCSGQQPALLLCCFPCCACATGLFVFFCCAAMGVLMVMQQRAQSVSLPVIAAVLVVVSLHRRLSVVLCTCILLKLLV
jgi:hypothetical protein